MVGQRLQPGAKAARRIVGELAQLLRQLEQNVLRHVLGVRFLQVPLAAPAVDLTAVVLDKFAPGRLVVGVEPQTAQQGDSGFPSLASRAML